MRTVMVMTLAASLLAGPTLAQGQSAADAYQSALQLEEVKGDLDKAIVAYKAILERYPNDRMTAGKAQLHLGFCYERLARPEARSAYEAVIRSFSDRPELVSQAKAHLAATTPQSGERAESAVVARQLWTGADVSLEGKPSPDGRYLTYVDWTSTNSGNVAIRDLTTGQNRRLTDSADMGQGYAEYPVLSPDGKTIAYGWDNSVRLIGVDGSRPRILVPAKGGLYPFNLSWSPDGTCLAAAFTDFGGDKTSRIVLISVADGSLTQLKSTGWRSPELGGFSPDGKFLVYAVGRSATGDDQDVLAIAVDGSGENVIVPGPSNDSQPSWTPDGKAIIFTSDRSGSQALWAIRVDRGTPKGSPQLIRPNVGEIWAQGFTRDGSFFYGSLNREADVYVATLDPSTLAVTAPPAPLTDRFVGSNTGATWSPDGRLVAFLRGTDRRAKSVVIRSVADGNERTLPVKIKDAYFPSQTGVSWFPDSRSVLMSDTDIVNRKSLFRRIDIETGQESLVFRATYQSIWPLVAIAPDGKALFYTNVEQEGDPAANNRLHLVRRDLATGRETELYGAVSDGVGFFGLSISPDGRQLAFMVNVGPNQRHLMTISTNGGTPAVIYRGTYTNPQPQGSVWTRDGRHILFKAEDGKQRTRVWAIPANGGAPRRLDLATQGIGKMDLSPDGRQLAFTGSKRKQEVWVIKNLVPASFWTN
jgi:Tol biopolymer transport system component